MTGAARQLATPCADPKGRTARTLIGGGLVVGGLLSGVAGCSGADADADRPAAASARQQRTPAPAGRLLPPVAAYVEAVNTKDLDGLVRAFAADGEVVDVGRRITGHVAIRGWAEREVIGGTLQVIGVVENGTGYQRLLVRFAPAGAGGFAAYYAFTVSGRTITRADLTYA